MARYMGPILKDAEPLVWSRLIWVSIRNQTDPFPELGKKQVSTDCN
jgi:hypothetical protein